MGNLLYHKINHYYSPLLAMQGASRACKRWWIFKFFGEELKANGSAFAAVQDNSAACNFLIINMWRAVTAVCAHVGVLSPPSIRMVSGCFHMCWAVVRCHFTAILFIFRKCKLIPVCQDMMGSNSRRLLFARPHAAPNLLFFVLLQDVPYVCFIPRCSCPLCSIK